MCCVLLQRISVPRQLVNLLARALQGLLPPLAHKPKLDQQASRKRHREKAYVVNYISQASSTTCSAPAVLPGMLTGRRYCLHRLSLSHPACQHKLHACKALYALLP